jgi:hypothetical protein
MLNDLLECKLRLDRGEDIGPAIDRILEQTDYPYPVWLKALNAQKQGRIGEAAEAGKRLLAFDEMYHYYVYGDLFTRAKYIVNPDYDPAEDAVLTIPAEDIVLADCKVDQPRRFTFEVRNGGKFPLLVRDIQLSCSCLKLLSPARFRLEPGQASQVEAEFTPDGSGEFYRELTFFSDTSDALQRVAVRATAL